MRIALIISLLLAVGATIFAIQNPGNTDVVLGYYEITASKALVIILTFVLGVIVGILASLPSRIRSRKKVRTLEHRIAGEPATAVPPATERVETYETRRSDL